MLSLSPAAYHTSCPANPWSPSTAVAGHAVYPALSCQGTLSWLEYPADSSYEPDQSARFPLTAAACEYSSQLSHMYPVLSFVPQNHTFQNLYQFKIWTKIGPFFFILWNNCDIMGIEAVHSLKIEAAEYSQNDSIVFVDGIVFADYNKSNRGINSKKKWGKRWKI